MRTYILTFVIGALHALHCDKEFNFYENYGNGYDVVCQGITLPHVHLLENISIASEISVKIENSALINVSSKIFKNVKHIKYLFLENSTFTFEPFASIFQPLKDLEHLSVRNTKLSIDKNTFIGLKNLKEITMYNNSLESIELGSFVALPALNYLHIIDNTIKNVKNIPLCELTKLREINLSRNLIRDLKKINFYCKHTSDSMTLTLNNDEHLLEITKRDFYSLSDITVELLIINLSYNKISAIGTSLDGLKNLKVLNLEGNILSKVLYKEFNSLINLEKLYLKNNMIENVEELVFFDKQYLEYIDLSYNKLITFKVNNTPMLEYLDLGYNKLNSMNLEITNTNYLKTLNLCNNKLEEVKEDVFHHLKKLETLNLGNNCNLKLHNQSLNGLIRLKDLNLSNTTLNSLPFLLFEDLVNLRKLDLSNNELKRFDYNGVFKGLSNLEILNISYNLLQELNYNVLEPLKNLNVLDIAGNQLHHIQYDLIISDLPLLSVLNIKSNYLSCEMLQDIIKFLKIKNVSYTVNKNFDYSNENVAGIICKSEKSLPFQADNIQSSKLFDLGIVLLIALLITILGVSFYKIHIFLRRRRYRIDEFELINE